MAEEDEKMASDDLIERLIEFLQNAGPEPDLSELPSEVAEQAGQMVDVVEALLNSGPSEIPLLYDPVAIRLGLVGPPAGEPVSLPADDPVAEAVREAEHRFSFVASPASTDGTDFERRFDCRSMVEHALVVVSPDPQRHALNAAHARSAFALTDDLSAVAYCSAAGTDAVVMTYSDCHNRIDPGSGWLNGGDDFVAEPLSLALGRYFERSDPRWEAVQSLEGLDTWTGIGDDAAAAVAGVKQDLAASRPQLAHKRQAREFVLAQPDSVFTEWATRVQDREINAEDVAAEIRALVEAVER